MEQFGSILSLNEPERQALSFYALAVGFTLLLCLRTKKRVIALSGAIVTVGWLVSVVIYLSLRRDAGPALALQGTSVALMFFWLWRQAKENNAPLFRRMFWIHTAYAAAAGYRLVSEIWFPESGAATYFVQQFIQNRIFDFSLIYLCYLSGIRIWDRHRSALATPVVLSEKRKVHRDSEGPRWLRNLLIQLSNDDKPESEHKPLIEGQDDPAPSNKTFSTRRIPKN